MKNTTESAANLISTNNKIENCEAIGRQWFYNNIDSIISGSTEVVFTPTTFRHDAEVVGANGKFAVEIKTRTCAHDAYDTNLIKGTKILAMQALAKKGFVPIYVNFYNDGYVRVWNLMKLRTCVMEMKYVRKTQMNDYSAMEEQPYYHLSMADSRTFKYNS